MPSSNPKDRPLHDVLAEATVALSRNAEQRGLKRGLAIAAWAHALLAAEEPDTATHRKIRGYIEQAINAEERAMGLPETSWDSLPPALRQTGAAE